MISLKVPYAQKDHVKSLGATWNPSLRTWQIDVDSCGPLRAYWRPEDVANLTEKLATCSACGKMHTKLLLDCYGGLCMQCDIESWSASHQGICLACGKKLVPIGTSRSNGAAHDDWDDRKYHKQCFKAMFCK